MKFKNIFISVFATLCVGFSFAQGVVKPTNPPKLVNDFAGVIDARVAKILEDSLVAFDKTTSTQILVVVVDDLNGYAPGDYALEVGREWGVGRKGKDNGVVILVKPRNKYGKGEVYISVGYGLEGVLNDAKAGRLIDKYMIPELKKGDYTGAVVNGAFAVMKTVRGEFKADDKEEGAFGLISFFVMLVGLVVIIVAVSKADKNHHDDQNENGGSSGGFFPPIIIGGFGGGRSSGGGSFGGFGGFGGGGFGGGGAGRSF